MKIIAFFIIGFAFLFTIGTVIWGIEILHTVAASRVLKEPVVHSASLVFAQNIGVVPDEISARSAVLLQAHSNIILAAKYPSTQYPPASIVKLLTAIVALEHYDPEAQIEIREEFIVRDESQHTKLRAGDIYKVKDLVHLILIESNNGAAYALSSLMGEEAFVHEMNMKAKLLGLQWSHFRGPSGLDYEESLSSAYDVAQLGRYLLHHNEILRILRMGTFDLFDADGRFIRKIYTTNELWGSIPNLVAAKTGYTDSSQGNLLVIVPHPILEDEFLISVVFGSEDRGRDVLKLLNLTQQ